MHKHLTYCIHYSSSALPPNTLQSSASLPTVCCERLWERLPNPAPSCPRPALAGGLHRQCVSAFVLLPVNRMRWKLSPLISMGFWLLFFLTKTKTENPPNENATFKLTVTTRCSIINSTPGFQRYNSACMRFVCIQICRREQKRVLCELCEFLQSVLPLPCNIWSTMTSVWLTIDQHVVDTADCMRQSGSGASVCAPVSKRKANEWMNFIHQCTVTLSKSESSSGSKSESESESSQSESRSESEPRDFQFKSEYRVRV